MKIRTNVGHEYRYNHYKKPVFFVMSPIMWACFLDVFELASNVPMNRRMSMRKWGAVEGVRSRNARVKQETWQCLQRCTHLGGRRRRHPRVRTIATLAVDNRFAWGENVEVTAVQGRKQPNVPKTAKQATACKRRK